MKKRLHKRHFKLSGIIIFALVLLTCIVCAKIGNDGTSEKDTTLAETTYYIDNRETKTAAVEENQLDQVSLGSYNAAINSIPDYSGKAVIKINNDIPFFTDYDKQYNGTYVTLSELDSLNRCGVAMACVGKETEPTAKRGDISHIHPSGWQSKKLNDGTYLYNRSHLLMYALTGLDDENRNLITGTRQFNADESKGMLAYETMVKWVVDNYNAHVLYRVTPVFEGDNLVAKGVLMEAYAIEYPEECEFCVFVYNVQDNVDIDYSNGNVVETTETTTSIRI